MSALIVFESAFGNTREIARAVVEGLGTEKARLAGVEEAPQVIPDDVTLLVVGAPTHAFGMSRPATREDAAGRGAARVSTGVREWIQTVSVGERQVGLAVFDTKASQVRHLPGAARGEAKGLRKRGLSLVIEAESFLVADITGPLLPGERERARAWGSRLTAFV